MTLRATLNDLSNISKTFDYKQFTAIIYHLGWSAVESAKHLGIGKRNFFNYRNGSVEVPLAVSRLLFLHARSAAETEGFDLYTILATDGKKDPESLPRSNKFKPRVKRKLGEVAAVKVASSAVRAATKPSTGQHPKKKSAPKSPENFDFL